MPAHHDGFDGKGYRPPAGTQNYVFAFVPRPAFPADAVCAVQIESEAYLDATGMTCTDHWIGERLTNLPTYMKETAPGLFTSTASETFTRLLLGGLGMKESPKLREAATPKPRGNRGRPDPSTAWSDPVDRYMDPTLRRAPDLNPRRKQSDDATETAPSTNPRDYYYAIMPDPDRASGDGDLVFIHLVSKAFFDREGRMDDEELDIKGLPSHFEALTEGAYHSPRKIMQVCMELESLGMTASRELDAYIREAMEPPTPRPGR